MLDIETHLAQTERKDLLRFLTAGSVDDGKSTLIGRLLYDTDNVPVDHAEQLVRDSARIGNAGDEIDYSLLLDGLMAEREQGITIDVAYRYFTTEKRKYIIADTPGHEQYTRNMATGASNADLAIILIDARQGVLAQTKRHSYIATLLNIRHLVVAVNKMDLVDWSEQRFNEIVEDYQKFSAKLPRCEYTFIPLSALKGENVVHTSPSMPWYQGKTLIQHLDQVQVARDRNLRELIFPVQHVIRPNLDFRGYAGTVASGLIRTGQTITALPSGKQSTVKSIVTYDGELEEAFSPQSVTVTLEDEIDISRGDVLVADVSEPHVGNGFEAMMVWMHDTPLQVGTQYLIKHMCTSVQAQVVEVVHRVDINSVETESADSLGLNEIAKVRIRTSRPIVFDIYRKNRSAGAFIVIDRMTNNTVGAGMISDHFSMESSVTRSLLDSKRREGEAVSAHDRAARFNQQPATVWITGGDGTQSLRIARQLEKHLFDNGYQPYVLDFANLNLDMKQIMGFTGSESMEDLRRAVALSRLCADAGLITIAVVGSGDHDGASDQLQVYVDEVLSEEDDSRVLAGSQAQMTKGADVDPVQASREIADMLRDRQILGFFPGSDQVNI